MSHDAVPLLSPAAGATSSWRPLWRLWWLAPVPVAFAAYSGYANVGQQWPVVKSDAASAPVIAADGAVRPSGAATSAAGTMPTPPGVRADNAKSRRPPASNGPLQAPAAGQPVAGALPKTGSSEPLKWPLWDFQLKQPVPPADPPLTPLNWRLVGAANDGAQWQLIILRRGKAEPEMYRVGQELPGNYKIEAITAEDVTLLRRGRRMVLSYIGY